MNMTFFRVMLLLLLSLPWLNTVLYRPIEHGVAVMVMCSTFSPYNIMIYISEINMHGGGVREGKRDGGIGKIGRESRTKERKRKMRNIYIYLCEFYRSKWYNSRYIYCIYLSVHGFGYGWAYACVLAFIRLWLSIFKHIPFISVDQNLLCNINISYWLTSKWYRVLEMMARHRLWLHLYVCTHYTSHTAWMSNNFSPESFGIVVNLFCMYPYVSVFVCMYSKFLCTILCYFLLLFLPIGIIVSCSSIWFNTCD